MASIGKVGRIGKVGKRNIGGRLETLRPALGSPKGVLAPTPTAFLRAWDSCFGGYRPCFGEALSISLRAEVVDCAEASAFEDASCLAAARTGTTVQDDGSARITESFLGIADFLYRNVYCTWVMPLRELRTSPHIDEQRTAGDSARGLAEQAWRAIALDELEQYEGDERHSNVEPN